MFFSTDQHEWENPAIFKINAEPAHATMIPYATETNALKANSTDSPFFKLLNGSWKFQFLNDPTKCPPSFFSTKYDDTSWNNIMVPSNWQLEGHSYLS